LEEETSISKVTVLMLIYYLIPYIKIT